MSSSRPTDDSKQAPAVQRTTSLDDAKTLTRRDMAVGEISEEKAKPPPYSVFNHWERWAIVALVSCASLFSPLTANIYLPAIPELSDAFHRSTEDINLTVTVYMIVQGLAPSFWGSFADRKGRRPSFIICLFILAMACVGLALTPTSDYWLLIVLRCLQAAGSASTVALSSGVMADIIPREERGGYMGISAIGPMLGPSLGPVVGGILVEHLGWRSIFWFLCIASSVSLLIVALFFPETLRAQVGNGSIPAPRWNCALIPIIGRSSLDTTYDIHHRPPPAPIPNPFRLFTAPDLVLNLFGTSIIYSTFYAVTATIATLFGRNYPFLTETDIGLCYLSIGGGSMISTIVTGKILDWQYQVSKQKYLQSLSAEARKERDGLDEKRSGRDDEGFPIEKARLQLQFYFVVLFVAAVISYGWVIEAGVSLAAPLVFQFVIGVVLTYVMTSVQTLSVDLFPTQGSSVTAAYNLVRCLMGAGAVSIVTPITDAIGAGWTYTIFGLACLLALPMLYISMRRGPKWRKARAERANAASTITTR